ncbi:MAG: hypothetical protein ACFB2X_01445 [Rivularia sp. (in: cyanobacteria)]
MIIDANVEDLFGKGSYQTQQFLFINKLSLNLIPNNAHKAEVLFAAIIFKASSQYVGYLTDNENIAITDPEGNPITFDNRVLFKNTFLYYYDRYFSTGVIRDVFEFTEYLSND